MATAFCPGHVTCFFRPAGDPGEDILSRGSIGAGIRLSLGSTVEVSERSGSGIKVVMDGAEVSAKVTEAVFSHVPADRGYEVVVTNGLPCGEGFGMSAAGAIASSLCLTELIGISEQEAFEIAHKAEIEGGGGLGDVSALYCLAHQPVRIRQGLPPKGDVVGTAVRFPKLSLAVLGPKMHTGNVLGNRESHDAIVQAGSNAVAEYMAEPTVDNLFRLSNRFSASAGVECTSVSKAIAELHDRGMRAGMCMLGNSIFSDASEGELSEVLGEDVQIFSCSSTDAPAAIIRKV